MQAIPSLLTLALCALTASGSTPDRSAVDAHFRRLMGTALERSESQLLKRTDFYRSNDTWEQAFEVSSEHYRLRTVGSRAAANKLIGGLEFMFAEFQSLLASDFEPAQRFQIDVMPLAEYNTRGGNAAEHSSFYGSFLEANGSVAVSYNPNSDLLGMLATHSALHQFTQAAFNRNPPLWIAEGLAAYFATFWHPEWSKSELQRVSSGRAWIGMRELITASASDYVADSHTRLIELGMLFKYLLQFNPDTAADSDAPFVNFLRSSVRGQRSASRLYTLQGMLDFEAGFRNCEY